MKLTYNDEQHAYWLDGKRCKGVTSVAKYPDDRYSLDLWAKRMVVIGMASSPPLVHRAAAHFDERDKIDAIAEEALTLAKTKEAAGRGTADHRITERVDLGLDIIQTPEAQAVADAWQQALDYLDVEIVPELVERIVIYPDLLIAGRFDRIARYRTTGELVMLDVKTGKNAVRYPHSTAIQLGLYANADAMAGPLKRGQNGSQWTDQFEALPDLNTDHALVVLLPPAGRARCFRLNITAGYEAAEEICFPTIQWRKRDDLVEEITKLEWTPTVELVSDQVEWVRQRVQLIKDQGYGDQLAALWSAHPDVPTFKKGGPQTVEQIDQIAAMCDEIERVNGLPFGATDPTYKPPVKIKQRTSA